MRGSDVGVTGGVAVARPTEIAVWAPSGYGSGPGYYCCFRLFIDAEVATGAVLFCLYDGTESSPALSTLEAAQAFARENGFVEETGDGANH